MYVLAILSQEVHSHPKIKTNAEISTSSQNTHHQFKVGVFIFLYLQLPLFQSIIINCFLLSHIPMQISACREIMHQMLPPLRVKFEGEKWDRCVNNTNWTGGHYEPYFHRSNIDSRPIIMIIWQESLNSLWAKSLVGSSQIQTEMFLKSQN